MLNLRWRHCTEFDRGTAERRRTSLRRELLLVVRYRYSAAWAIVGVVSL